MDGKVEKVIINGKHMLLIDDIFTEDDPDYADIDYPPEEEISEEEFRKMFIEDTDRYNGEPLPQQEISAEELAAIFTEDHYEEPEPQPQQEISDEELADIFVEDYDMSEPNPTFQESISDEELAAIFVDEDGTPFGDYEWGILNSVGDGEYFGMSPEEHDEQLRRQKKEQGLPHKLRMDLSDSEIVRLKDERNLTLREIAERLHCSPNTVRNRYNKAKGIK